MNRIFWGIALLLAATGCAGPNPNPGERTTDMAWTSRNYQRAFERAAPSADAGEPWAQLRLGVFYENGWGTSIDLEKAEDWYKKAAVQKASGGWAEGQMVGAVGKSGYFNQNSDARIAEFNLAQLYLKKNKNLAEAHQLISNLIKETEGKDVFFCCEFAGGRYFTQEQFIELKEKIEERMNGQ
jgi:TPR repeat protein